MNKQSQPDLDRDDRNLRAVRAAQAGGDAIALRTALGQLVGPYWEWARSIAFGKLSGVPDRAGNAEVIAQEVTAKLTELAVKEPEDADAPMHILARIWLMIFLRRYWRRHGRDKGKMFSVAEIPFESETEISDDQQSLLREALEFVPYIDGLSEGDRELLTERMLLGLTPEQSAARRGIPRGTLDTRYSRALDRARRKRRELDVREPDEGAA
jgi:DNA-directed RNA polymerase specialized sigma24 family protein